MIIFQTINLAIILSISRLIEKFNVTWPNKSDVVTVTVVGNLYEEKILQL